MLEFSGAQEQARAWRRFSGTESDTRRLRLRRDNSRVIDVREPKVEASVTELHFDPSQLVDTKSDLSSDSQAVAKVTEIGLVVPEISRDDRHAVGRTLRLLAHALDFAAFTVPFLVTMVFNVVNFGELDQVKLQLRVIILYGVIGTLLLAPTMRQGRLVVRASEGLASIAGRVCLAPVLTLMAAGVVQFLQLGTNYSDLEILRVAVLVAVTVPLVLLGRLASSKLVEIVRAKGYDLEDVIIVGTGPVGVQVAEALLENPQFGLLPYGFVDRFDDEMPLPLIGRPEDLREILQLSGVRHVVLAFGAAEEQELVDIIRDCHDQMVQFYAVPRLFELGISSDSVGHEVSGLPLVEVHRPGTASNMWPAKRAFDVVVAGFLTILALPILAACALAVRFSSKGPIFFKQVRIGVGGQPFEILKFRTMRVNDDSSTQWSVDDDDRVTWAGKFLRPSHLDELPQLLNVLRGEMSLVGPRPERPHFVEQFSSEIDEYDYRHRVPVGITGWAQVNGYWGDTSIETRVRLDNRYIENWSLWRDLVIGLRTIPTLLGKRR